METEITDPIISPEQESKEIATIAKASIANIEANKKAYEELRDQYRGTKSPDFKDPEFKATLKKLTQGSGALVKARTAATKLGKQETDKLDKVKVMIKSAVEELIAITADTEKEIKAEKERADQMIADDKAAKELEIEELKQGRLLEILELGCKVKGDYYQIGDISVTKMEIANSSQAGWEGKISQIKIEYEAEQLRIAEEDAAETQRQAELIANQQKLQEQNNAKQAELDAIRQEQELMRFERTESRVDALKQRGFDGDLKVGKMRRGTFEFDAAFIVDANKASWDSLLKEADDYIYEASQPKVVEVKPAGIPMRMSTPIKPTNGAPILEEVENEYMDEVLAQPDDSVLVDDFPTNEPSDSANYAATLFFTDQTPFIDTMVGKATLRIYPECFIVEASEGLKVDMVSATGSISDELLFMVIKPR